MLSTIERTQPDYNQGSFHLFSSYTIVIAAVPLSPAEFVVSAVTLAATRY